MSKAGSIRLTFLGTGTSQGVPVIACQCEVCTSEDTRNQRLRSSVLIQSETTTVVIDTGPDFRQQMLKAKPQRLDAVVFTHEHKDHVAGLDDVRAFNFKQKQDMPLYCTAQVETALRREFHYAFAEHKYPGVPNLEFRRIENKPFKVGDLEFIPIQVLHHRLPVFGFRIGDITYITDANAIEPAELEKVKGSKVLILNALRIASHVSHFNLTEAINLAEYIAAEQTYFTHISHYLGLHETVSQSLPDSVALAVDGMEIWV